jgi:hypothetical protein
VVCQACQNLPVLSDDTLGPLDLDAALHVAQAAGADAVIVLLEQTLTDPGLRADTRMAGYLDTLVEAYTAAGRQSEAIATLHRVARQQPQLRGRLIGMIAGLHAEAGDRDTAAGLISQQHAQQQALPPADRDIGFYTAAAIAAAGPVGDRQLARRLVADGLDLTAERDDEDSADQALALHILAMQLSAPSRSAAHRPAASSGLDRGVPRRRGNGEPGRQRLVYRVAYLPEPEYAAA